MSRRTRAQAKLALASETPFNLPDDLPAPSTSRPLHPRSRATSLARSEGGGSVSRPGSRASSMSRGSSASAWRTISRRTSMAQVQPQMDQDTFTAGESGNRHVQSAEEMEHDAEMDVSIPPTGQMQAQPILPPVGRSAAVDPACTAAGFTGLPPSQIRQDASPSSLRSDNFLSMEARAPESELARQNHDSSPSRKRKREHPSGSEDASDTELNTGNHSEGPVAGPSWLSTAFVDHFSEPDASESSNLGQREGEVDSDGEMDSGPSVPPSQEPPSHSQQSSHTESENEISQQLSMNEGSLPVLESNDDIEESLSLDKGKARNYKGKGKAKAIEPDTVIEISDSSTKAAATTLMTVDLPTPSKPPPELMSSYTCPICFSPPTNATLTPCGHICCGACLFTAVKTTIQRSTLVGAGPGANDARCPVCRATIPGWDGKGGGVIGLKARAIFRL